ncbi:MAG: hypothetical protein M3198_12325 [Actinomycetota bacterium]|nr:hypothetical protein [Actinomycetota bacterium]
MRSLGRATALTSFGTVLSRVTGLARLGVVDEEAMAGQAFSVAVPVAVGAVAFVGLAYVLRVPELGYVRNALGRRLGRQ